MKAIFQGSKIQDSNIIGCIHLLPLPGSPCYKGSMDEIISHAINDIKIYNKYGFGGVIIENTYDLPYPKGFAFPETIASMTAVCREIRKETKLPIGIQILAGAAIESLAVAVASDLQFVRVEGFSFAHVADEGIMQSCAAELLRKRAGLRSERILLFVDIKKKHSAHAITSDISIGFIAKTCEVMKADGIIVTGGFTGSEPSLNDLDDTRANTTLPVLIGSGITTDNFDIYKNKADAFIVGSYFKRDGNWMNEIDEKRIIQFFEAMK